MCCKLCTGETEKKYKDAEEVESLGAASGERDCVEEEES